MIRAQLMRHGQESKNGFRMRGTEITRLEGFSDTVFGFAVTLLVVSLEVPTDFDQLVATMRNLLPFAICFAVLTFLWYNHYLFFRRYGLQDHTMILLNALLLFVILAYIYPLKFIFSQGFVWITGQQSQADGRSSDQQVTLFVIYGLGWAAVFTIFAIFYLHAYRQRAVLELTPLEIFDTRANMYANLEMVGVGLFSILLARLHVGIDFGVPGWAYFLIAPVQTFFGRRFGQRRRVLMLQLSLESPSVAHKTVATPDTSS
jgi:Endosomal/lysosomal potassium channel TMEM175